MAGEMAVLDHDDDTGTGMVATDRPTMPTMIALAAATLDKRIATARQWPRSIAKFKAAAADLIRQDKQTAMSAEYSKPVAGGKVTGPSVRLAELVAMCWGNLEVEVSEPVIGDGNVIVKATAWDLQNNYRQEAMASTSILKKNGERYPQHMIDTAINATAAKAKRNAILAVIPRTYVNELLEVARKVARGAEEPLDARRKKLLASFDSKHRVPKAMIFDYLQVGGESDITEGHIDELRTVWTSISDGEATVAEFFGDPKSKVDAVKDKAAGRKKSSVLAEPPAPAAEPEPPAYQQIGDEPE